MFLAGKGLTRLRMSWNEILRFWRETAASTFEHVVVGGRSYYPSSDTTSTDVQAIRLTAEYDLDNSHVGVRKWVIIVIVRGPCVVRCDNDVSSLYTN